MTMTSGSAISLMDSYLDAHPAPEVVGLALGGIRVDVRTNSPELAAALRGYFHDFLGEAGPARFTVAALELPPQELGLELVRKAPEPGKTRTKEEYRDLPDGRVVRKRLTGMTFVFGGGRNLAVGPCLANLNQIVNFINNRYIEILVNRGGLLGHAAGVTLGDRGLALAGFSGMGKSTLALRLMCHPWTRFVSNDRLVVERGPMGLVMHGVAKMPRVNPGTVLHNESLEPVMPAGERERFEALSPDELWSLEHKYDAFIDRCFGPGRFDLTAPLTGLVVINWRRDGGPLQARRVRLEERRDLLPAFMKNVGLFYQDPGQEPGQGPGLEEADSTPDFSEEAYLDMLLGLEVVELAGGIDFEAGAAACLTLLLSPGTTA